MDDDLQTYLIMYCIGIALVVLSCVIVLIDIYIMKKKQK